MLTLSEFEGSDDPCVYLVWKTMLQTRNIIVYTSICLVVLECPGCADHERNSPIDPVVASALALPTCCWSALTLQYSP